MYYVLCKPKTLRTQELRQRAAKYCCLEIMFIAWAVHATLTAAPPTPLIPLPFASNKCRMHRFVQAIVRTYYCIVKAQSAVGMSTSDVNRLRQPRYFTRNKRVGEVAGM